MAGTVLDGVVSGAEVGHRVPNDGVSRNGASRMARTALNRVVWARKSDIASPALRRTSTSMSTLYATRHGRRPVRSSRRSGKGASSATAPLGPPKRLLSSTRSSGFHDVPDDCGELGVHVLVASRGPGDIPTVDQELTEAEDEELARRHLARHVLDVSLERTGGAKRGELILSAPSEGLDRVAVEARFSGFSERLRGVYSVEERNGIAVAANHVIGELLHRPAVTDRRCIPRVWPDGSQPLLVLVGRTFEKGGDFDPRDGTPGVINPVVEQLAHLAQPTHCYRRTCSPTRRPQRRHSCVRVVVIRMMPHHEGSGSDLQVRSECQPNCAPALSPTPLTTTCPITPHINPDRRPRPPARLLLRDEDELRQVTTVWERQGGPPKFDPTSGAVERDGGVRRLDDLDHRRPLLRLRRRPHRLQQLACHALTAEAGVDEQPGDGTDGAVDACVAKHTCMAPGDTCALRAT